MNYRHAYHAGNFADVLKHIVLARVITYMKQKPQPFRVIDTHAGAGLYDVTGTEAAKTGEWRDGIGRLLDADLPHDVAELITPYLDAVRAQNTSKILTFYPGSPLIARHLMRAGDQLVANELHSDDCKLLAASLKRQPDAKVLNLDGWQAVKSLLPPKERRGVILIDPPFEDADEFENIQQAVMDGLSRFETGVFLIWYPLKDQSSVASLVNAVRERAHGKILNVRLRICAPEAGLGLTETGLLAINPPFTLKAELEVVLPLLAHVMAEGRGAGFSLD